jgi:GxxExxY protein
VDGFEPIPEEVERIAAEVVDAAIKVHRILGPGLLESVYEHCLAYELTLRGFHVRRQVPVPVVYEGMELDAGYRMDLLVNELVIVECKAVRELHPIDRQQTLTHLKLGHKRLGFLINFNVTRLKDGLNRVIH